jgi:hypothetical protein
MIRTCGFFFWGGGSGPTGCPSGGASGWRAGQGQPCPAGLWCAGCCAAAPHCCCCVFPGRAKGLAATPAAAERPAPGPPAAAAWPGAGGRGAHHVGAGHRVAPDGGVGVPAARLAHHQHVVADQGQRRGRADAVGAARVDADLRGRGRAGGPRAGGPVWFAPWGGSAGPGGDAAALAPWCVSVCVGRGRRGRSAVPQGRQRQGCVHRHPLSPFTPPACPPPRPGRSRLGEPAAGG